MSRQFVLPDLGEGLTEAEIVSVFVHEGDVIKEDAPLLEVETDKAQVEIPSPLSGRVEKIHVQPGQTVKVGAVLVTFADNGAAGGAPAAAAPRAAAPGAKAATAPSPAPAPARTGPVPATPATRRLARELGVDLSRVRGSGPGGRVLDDDVRAAAGGRRTTPAQATPAAATPPARSVAPAEPAGPAKPLVTPGLTAPPLPRFEQWGPVERAPL